MNLKNLNKAFIIALMSFANLTMNGQDLLVRQAHDNKEMKTDDS